MNTLTSVCCVKKACAKLCTVIPGNREPEIARLQKAEGYLVADPNTPLVSNYARAILRVYHTENHTYPDPDNVPPGVISAELREVLWKIKNGPYLFDPDDQAAAFAYAALDCKTGVEEIEALCQGYDDAKTHEDMEALATTTPSPLPPEGFKALY